MIHFINKYLQSLQKWWNHHQFYHLLFVLWWLKGQVLSKFLRAFCGYSKIKN